MKIRNLAIFTFMVASLLAACNGDDEQPQGEPLQLWSLTRAEGEASSNDVDGLGNILLYMTRDDNASFFTGTFRYDGNDKWSSLASANAEKYHVYGYMAKTDKIDCTLEKLTDAEDYTGGAVLHFKKLPPVVPYDLCIIQSVKKPSNEYIPFSFAFDNTTGPDQNKLCVQLTHLYASLTFCMAIGSSYDELRTIRLRQLSVVAQTSELDLGIGLLGGAEDLQLTTTPTMAETAFPLFNSEEGHILSTTAETIATGYFSPTLATNLALRCTYDIFDKKGNLTRSNCVAENKLTLPEGIARGQQQTITITVEPTYLYQLSEGELDSPTIKQN